MRAWAVMAGANCATDTRMAGVAWSDGCYTHLWYAPSFMAPAAVQWFEYADEFLALAEYR